MDEFRWEVGVYFDFLYYGEKFCAWVASSHTPSKGYDVQFDWPFKDRVYYNSHSRELTKYWCRATVACSIGRSTPTSKVNNLIPSFVEIA